MRRPLRQVLPSRHEEAVRCVPSVLPRGGRFTPGRRRVQPADLRLPRPEFGSGGGQPRLGVGTNGGIAKALIITVFQELLYILHKSRQVGLIRHT